MHRMHTQIKRPLEIWKRYRRALLKIAP